MNKFEAMEDYQFLFGIFFIISNRMDTLLERELKSLDITTKQWLLSAVISGLFDNSPTLKEAAHEMGSSHQNVKQIAHKLEQKGLLSLDKDKNDARVTRLVLTEKSKVFWADTQPKGIDFIKSIFKNISDEDMSKTREVFYKILNNLSEMENKL